MPIQMPTIKNTKQLQQQKLLIIIKIAGLSSAT